MISEVSITPVTPEEAFSQPEMQQPAQGEQQVQPAAPAPPVQEQPVAAVQPEVAATVETPAVEQPKEVVVPEVKPEIKPEPVNEYAELEKDPRFKDFAKAFKDGKIDEYIQEQTKYDRMASADVIREDIKRNNPTLSDKAVDALYKKELDSFNVDGYDDDDATVAKELMDAKANQIRDGWKKSNAPIPSTDVVSPEDQIKAYQESATAQVKQQVEDAIKSIQATPDYKAFETSRIVKTGGDFNYEVPKEVDVIKSLTDASAFGKLITDESGKLDIQKGLRLIAFAHDMDAYDKASAAYHFSLGKKSEYDELVNPKANVLPANATTPAAAKKFEWVGAVEI